MRSENGFNFYWGNNSSTDRFLSLFRSRNRIDLSFCKPRGGVAGGTLRAMFVTSPPRKTIFDSKEPSPLLHHSMIHLTSPFGCLLHDKILIRLHLKTKKFPARERWVTKLWIDRHSEDPNRLQHQESTHSLRGSITADLLSCLKTAILIMLNLIQIYVLVRWIAKRLQHQENTHLLCSGKYHCTYDLVALLVWIQLLCLC